MNPSGMKNNIKTKIMRIFIVTAAFAVCSLFLFRASASPQQLSKKDLEDKKKKIQQEIEYKKKLLDEIKGNKNKNMIQLAIYNNKIKDHEELISTIGVEIGFLNGQINETNTNIKIKENELQKLKDDYAKMVFAAYKNRSSYDRLMFIFSAADFNQAYQRVKYFQVFSDLRKKQADAVIDRKKELNQNLQGLEEKKSEQNNLLGDKETEKNNLLVEKENKTVTLNELMSQESDVKEEIKKKKQQADKIKKLIDKIIADEIKKQQDLLAQKNKDNPKNPADLKHPKKNTDLKIELTPEEALVSKNFEGNEGKLPWPLAQGVITERFGQHEHPDMPGITVYCDGIVITSNKGSVARTVFDGEVISISEIPGVDGKVVIIRHGEYMSAYFSLEDVYVQKGDKVKTKTEIGKVVTDETGKTELHLQIYKGKTLLDPENWIVVRN